MRCWSRARAAAAVDARRHHGLAVGVERRQRVERGQRFGREDVGITGLEGSSDLERSRWHSYR